MASAIDRVLRPLRPAAVAGWCPPPRAIADGVWSVERRLRFPPGLVLPCAMTVVRTEGGLVLVSPVALDAPTRAQLAALGPVAAVLAPNSFHYLFAAAYGAAFPDARTYLAPGLAARVPTAPRGSELTDAVSLDGDDLAHVVVGTPATACEVALLHRPSKTLILTDLAMNVTTIEPAWQRWLWRASGILPRFGPSRSARLTLLRDRAAVHPQLAAIARWDFDRIALAHGAPVLTDGARVFTDAFRAWLD